ncbi:MAG: arylesterase [Thiomicrorhabdus sp.]|nr:arylesterase [Thiomicrorhabdus sp.]
MLIGVVFHPSLSAAQPQAPLASENMKHHEVKVVSQSLLDKVDTRPGTLLVMGDSLSAAYGIDVEQGWVSLLQKHYPQVEVVNASISGETTSGGEQRLEALLQKYRPQVMLLELGANDALRGQDLNVIKSNLQRMIEACPKFNQTCKVILLGVQLPTNYGPLYDQLFQKMYRDLAEKNALLFDPFFIEPVALDPDLMQMDGLHPNAEGQPLILQRIVPLLDTIFMKPN